jgi:hypothetical protein
MAKRAILSSDNNSDRDPRLIDIDNLVAQLSTKIVDFLGDFSKSTLGKKSVSDYSLEFIKIAYQGVLDNPKIVAESFGKEDFGAKLGAIITYSLLTASITAAINDKWATNLMICKTDALNYANEFYGIVQREALKDVKYQPLLDSLKVFYKKTKSSDKTDTTTAKKSRSKKKPVVVA